MTGRPAASQATRWLRLRGRWLVCVHLTQVTLLLTADRLTRDSLEQRLPLLQEPARGGSR
jgi:hypothetical protein